MTPFGVKAFGKAEFDIFEARKRFSDSGKTCVLKRKEIPQPKCLSRFSRTVNVEKGKDEEKFHTWIYVLPGGDRCNMLGMGFRLSMVGRNFFLKMRYL